MTKVERNVLIGAVVFLLFMCGCIITSFALEVRKLDIMQQAVDQGIPIVIRPIR